MPQIQIADATIEQLREFLELQNIPYPPRSNAAHLRNIIDKSGWTKPHIDVAEVEARPTIDVSYAPQAAADYQDPKQVDPELKPFLLVDLQIMSREGQTQPVPVTNGRGDWMTVPRNRKVSIPYPYYESLAHAQKRVFPETETGIDEGYLVHSYPHQVFRVYEETDPAKVARIKSRVSRMQQQDAESLVAMDRASAKARERAGLS